MGNQKKTAYILWICSIGGILGFQQFYLGKIGKGIAYLFTAGFWGIGAVIDLFTLGSQVDKYNIQQKHQGQSSVEKETNSDLQPSGYVVDESSSSTTSNTISANPTKTIKAKQTETSKKIKVKKETKKSTKVKEELSIGHVEQKGGQVVVYDSNGKRIKNMSLGGGELKGYGTDFFVLSKAKGNATTYDLNCKHIKAIPIADYEIIGASGKNFTTKRKNKIRVYDKKGKMISSRNV